MPELEPKEVLSVLVNTASPYWGAERETVVRFLEQPVVADEHITTLGFLCHKEAWGSGLAKDKDGLIGGPIIRSFEDARIRKYPNLYETLGWLRRDFSKLGLGCSLEDYQADLSKAALVAQGTPFDEELENASDEFSHFRLFASIARDFFGQNFSPLNVRDLQSPYDLILQRLRDDVRAEHGAMGAAASRFTEGGGAAIFDGMQEFADDEDEYPRRWAELGVLVFSEEISHMQVGVREVSELISSNHELEIVTDVVEKISYARVRMRNEIFGNPLEKSEIMYLGMPDSSIKPFIPEPIQQLIA